MKEISAQNRDPKIKEYPLQDFYYIPVKANLYVNLEEEIEEGRLLTSCTATHTLYHSPVSGSVTNIINYNNEKYIEIKRDGDIPPMHYSYKPPNGISSDDLIDRIKNAGIFLEGGILHENLKQAKNKVDDILVNCVDKGPFVTASSALLKEKLQEILKTLFQLKYILNAKRITIVISKNAELQKEIESLIFEKNINIAVVPKRYPLHNEKLLINHVLKKEIKHSALEHKIVILDSETVYAMYEALYFKKPQTERVVSLDGAYALNHGNYKVKFGTAISAFMRPYSVESSYVMFAGNPLTGTPLESEKSLTKNINAIMIFEGKPRINELFCSLCNICVYNCPVHLNPVRLVDLLQHREYNIAKKEHIDKCIDCNICTYVCPSYITLGEVITNYNKGGGNA